MSRLLGLVTALLFVFQFVSCKKSDSQGEENGGTGVTGKLQFDKAQYTPGELVVITSAEAISGTQTTITIGGKQVQASVSNGTTIQFLLPVLETGSYATEVAAGGKKYTENLGVGNYVKITAYTDTLNKVAQALNAGITYLKSVKDNDTTNKLVFSYTDIMVLEKIQAEYQKQLVNLGAADKEMMAYVFRQFKLAESLSNKEIMWPDPKFTVKLNGSLADASDEIFKSGQSFKNHVISIAAIIGGVYYTTAVPELTSKVLALVLAGAGVYKLCQANQEVAKIFDISAKAVTADFVEQKFIVKHVKDKSTALTLGAKFETMTNADLNSPSAWMKNLATDANKIGGYYDAMNGYLAKLKNLFSWNEEPKMSTFKTFLPTTPKSKVLACNPEYLKIENISNPAIKLTTEATDEGFKVNCTSDLLQDVEFTYDLVYQHPQIKLPMRTSITGQYLGKPNKLVGTWEATELIYKGHDVFAGYDYSFKPLLAGCNYYMGYVQVNKWTLTFAQDGTFENYQGYINTRQDYTPVGYAVCQTVSTKTIPATTFTGGYNIADLNTNGQLSLYISSVSESVAGGFGQLSYTLKLLDETTMELTAPSANARYILKKKP